MSTQILVNQVKAAFFRLRNDKTLEEIPAMYSDIVFKSQNTLVFGLLADPTPSTMDIQVTGQGSTLLLVEANITYKSPKTGQVITQRKTTVLPLSVVSQGSDYVVTFS
jgi:hypothetical protein